MSNLKSMTRNIPNILTLLRIVLIPFFVITFFIPTRGSHIAASVIFALAAFTDWLDGYLARRLGQTSAFGAFLDPVADKLMVAAALVLIVAANPTPFTSAVLAIPCIIIIGREIGISALREWMAELGERAQVAVSVIGKIKTTTQMIAIMLLLYRDPIGQIPTPIIGFIFLLVAAGLTMWSMAIYLKAAWPVILSNHK